MPRPQKPGEKTPDRRGLCLTSRLAVGLCLGAALVLAGAGAWNLRLQRSHLTRIVEMSAERCAGIIRSSTREGMLHNRPDTVSQIIDTIARQEAVERIRLFDKRGQVRHSSRPEEIGTIVGTDSEVCVGCHPQEGLTEQEATEQGPAEEGRGGDIQTPQQARQFRTAERRTVLEVVEPIRNEPECSGGPCHAHPPDQDVLGVLDVQLSMGSVDDALAASQWQLLAGLAVAVGAVLVVAWALTWRLVLRPVRRLSRAASRVAAGELSARVPVGPSREIGDLTRAWNHMVLELDRTRRELEEWVQTLETRVREKTAELEKAHRRMLVVEKMASLGKLAAVVAHEINNPLAGICTYARLLRRKLAGEGGEHDRPAGVDDDTERALRLIDEEATRCGEIVHELLRFSRLPLARFSEVDLKPVFERCVMLLRRHAERKGLDLGFHTEPGLPRILCDAAQIEQMLLALGVNAVEATPSGGSVRLSAREDGAEQVVLEVSDSGKRIPEEDLNRIFEPYFTTKDQAHRTGLGLSIVYGIVTRHGGTIEVDSSAGRGTTFAVRLPVRPARAEEAAEEEEVAEAVPARGARSVSPTRDEPGSNDG